MELEPDEGCVVGNNEDYERECADQTKKNILPGVNRDMLPAKFSYIFLFSSIGCYHPYLVVFLKSIGISVSHAGVVVGIRMLVSCFASSCFNAIGDFTHRNMCIFWFLCIASTLMIFPLPWIAQDALSAVARKNCSGDSFTGKAINKDTLIANCHKNMLFFIMLAVNIVNAIFTQPIAPYLDPVVVALVKKKKNISFTQQRIFGAVGFGIGALLAGIASDNLDPSGMPNYSAVFFIYLPSMIMLIISSLFLFKQYKAQRSGDEHSNNKNVGEQFVLIAKTCIQWRHFVFLLTILVVGAANGLLYLFTFLLLEELDASKTLMGFSIVFLCVAELIMFPLSEKIIKLCKGPYVCVLISVFSYFLRFMLYSLIHKPWLILPIQFLHSFGYALFWESAFKIIEMTTPKKILLPMLAFTQSLFFDFGFMIAFISGGFAYDRYKGKLLFRGASYIALLWSAIMLIVFCFTRNDKKTRERVDTEMELITPS